MSTSVVIDNEPPAVTRDWRDTFRDATDIALLGVCVTVGSLLVLTAGASWHAGSRAMADWLSTSRWPSARVSVRRFAASLLPGAVAVITVTVVAALLVLNVSAVARGVVPGGAPVALALAAVSIVVLGGLASVLVQLGRGSTYRDALGSAWRLALARPLVPSALGLVCAIAGFLALILPVSTPLLIGVTLFAIHVLSRRLAA